MCQLLFSFQVNGTEIDEEKYKGSFDESMQSFIADADCFHKFLEMQHFRRKEGGLQNLGSR